MRDFKLRRRFNKLVKDGGAGGGAGGGVMRVGMEDGVMDKTWKEISDCVAEGGIAFLSFSATFGNQGFSMIDQIVNLSYGDGIYSVKVFEDGETDTYTCASPDGYPSNSPANS